MISLSFQNPHRSILSLPSVELPDFTVITGMNGCGKTHLLEAIKSSNVAVAGITANDDEMRLFDWGNLKPIADSTANGRVSHQNRGPRIDKIYRDFLGLQAELRRRLTVPQIQKSVKDLSDLIYYDQLAIMERLPEDAKPIYRRVYDFATQRAQRIVGAKNLFARLNAYAEQWGTAVWAISRDQLEEMMPAMWDETDIFRQNLSDVFAAYYANWHENRFFHYANAEWGESNPTLSQDDFYRRFGEEPWKLVNRILDELRIGYEVTPPTGYPNEPFEAHLIDKVTRNQFRFEDLSSGERIIMAFALCVYGVADDSRLLKYPKLLLLDEVDAPLHPTMTRNLLGVIERVLVGEKQIKVILTTHSPSTAALAPKDSIYRLEQHPRKLTRCTRDESVQILTNGFISVTDGTRFVLTEAIFDRNVYSQLVRKLVERGKLMDVPNLVFVQASDKENRDGGREQVRSWSTKLPEVGLTHLFGLIDRDANNTPSTFVKVIGRYSVENYLLDPIVIYALLMLRDYHEDVIDIGIKDANIYELKNADDAALQRVADWVKEVIEAHAPSVNRHPGTFRLEYVSGRTISAPCWLRDTKGHELEVFVRNALQKKFPKFNFSKDDLLEVIGTRLPEFIPEELRQTFLELQGHSSPSPSLAGV